MYNPNGYAAAFKNLRIGTQTLRPARSGRSSLAAEPSSVPTPPSPSAAEGARPMKSFSPLIILFLEE